MKLFVTLLEETADAAIDAIRALRDDHDGVEVRAERFPSIDLHAIRAATAKPLILTYRGAHNPNITAALDAGIDFVDIEWHEGVELLAPERTVLSHHDYEAMRDVESIVRRMQAHRCAHTKLAATPQNFDDNERLLALIPSPLRGEGQGEGRTVRESSPVTLTLSPRSGERGPIVDVRGAGLMWGIELDRPASPVARELLSHGFVVGTAREKVLRLLPPYIVPKKALIEFITALGLVLSATTEKAA